MKIGIHNESIAEGVGGSEVSVARLAEALGRNHTVEILHHKRTLTRDQLAEYSGANLSAVGFRYVEPEPYSFGTSHVPWRRYNEAKRWRASLSVPYDVFICLVHGFPSFCQAPLGVLVVLFPYEGAEAFNPALNASNGFSPTRWAKRTYHRWEWRQRLSRYRHRIAISEFTRTWARRKWGIECDVIYPPVETNFDVEEKSDFILSVGRFATQGHSKKQLEMLSAFSALSDDLPGWEYFCVGGIEESDSGQAYLARARRMARDTRAHVEANIERDRLRSLYQRSKIFWHAAGFEENEEDHPERAEHFGIATVEAMAAGCVPVVINKGGQRELVEHGVSGFLWNTLEELRRYTTQVARDERLRLQMAEAARARAQLFTSDNFVKGIVRLFAEAS